MEEKNLKRHGTDPLLREWQYFRISCLLGLPNTLFSPDICPFLRPKYICPGGFCFVCRCFWVVGYVLLQKAFADFNATNNAQKYIYNVFFLK
jgi:hypothetical protein